MTGPDPLEGADSPRARLTEAVQAYRAKFGRMPPIMGIPSTRYPELIAELWAAVRDGVPRSDSDFRRALGISMPPAGVDI